MVTPEEFLLELRRQLDDEPAHDEEEESARLWKTEELYLYMNRAQDALCSWANYLPGEVAVSVIAGEQEFSLPYRVIDVKDAYLQGAKRNLSIRNRDELSSLPADDYGLTLKARWRDAQGAAAATLVLDYFKGGGLLIPEPQVDDTLILVGDFLPLPVQEAEQFFTRRPDHIWALMPHVKMQAYGKHDADAYDPELSQKYKFEALEAFNLVDHQVKKLRKSSHHGAGTVAYGGIR